MGQVNTDVAELRAFPMLRFVCWKGMVVNGTRGCDSEVGSSIINRIGVAAAAKKGLNW